MTQKKDNLKNEDNIINEGDLKNEHNLKNLLVISVAIRNHGTRV